MLQFLDKLTNGHSAEALAVLGILVIIRVVISLVISVSVKMKGHNEIGYFFLCLIFGIGGYIAAAALPDNRVLWALDDIYERLEQNGKDSDFDGIIVKNGDKRAPSGTVAYMPKASSGSEGKRSEAVTKLQQYWSKEEEKQEAKRKKKDEKDKKTEKKTAKQAKAVDKAAKRTAKKAQKELKKAAKQTDKENKKTKKKEADIDF